MTDMFPSAPKEYQFTGDDLVRDMQRRCSTCRKATADKDCAPGVIRCGDSYQGEVYRQRDSECNLTVGGYEPRDVPASG